MPLILNRICIYTKDVMRITGRSEFQGFYWKGLEIQTTKSLEALSL